jgi:hypothetical protein
VDKHARTFENIRIGSGGIFRNVDNYVNVENAGAKKAAEPKPSRFLFQVNQISS